MATRYENSCDRCKKVTKSIDYDRGWGDIEYAKDNWDLRICNNWFSDGDEMSKKFNAEVEVNLDLCHECAKYFGTLIKADMAATKLRPQ